MLDNKGRIQIKKQLIAKAEDIILEEKVNMFYDPNQKNIFLKPKNIQSIEGMYFVASHTMDKQGRIHIPLSIRQAFPNATYLPAEKDGNIYILIINHEKSQIS